MFGLRQKLLLGFGGLLIILVAIGIQSIAQLSAQSPLIDVILNEDYQSVLACQKMKESLQRIDSGIERFLLGRGDSKEQSLEARRAVEAQQVEFEQAFERQTRNINVQGEAEKTDELREQYAQLSAAMRDLLRRAPEDDESRREYFKTVHPMISKCIATSEEILRLNQENMELAGKHAKEKAAETVRSMYLMFVAGAIAAIVFFLFIQRWILRPIQTMTASVQEVERGNLETDVHFRSGDEFATLAMAFNSMAARLRDVREGEQARLLRTERTTQLAVDSLHDAVALLSPDGSVEVVNETATALFELRPGVRVENYSGAWLKDLWTLANGGKTMGQKGYESSLQVFDKGEEKFFLPKAIPIRGENQRLLGVTVVLADITHLRKLDELKSGLLSTTSHELKTPLTSLQMAIHLLIEKRKATYSAQERELLESALADVDRLRALVDSILDLSRIEAGRVRMDLRPLHARDIVESVLQPLRARLDELQQTARVDVPDDTPDVLADPHRVGLVMTNLLTNASKYSPRGTPIGIRATFDDERVTFTVTDRGIGIPPEHCAHVFERFYRVPNQMVEGAGLGLAIAKEIVEAHGGEMACRSEPGIGSSFSFTLRRANP